MATGTKTITGKARIIAKTEFKIANNDFVDSNREGYITPIFDAISGLQYYPFRADTGGFGYYEIGDRVTVSDPAGNVFEVVIFDISINLSGGFSETIQAKIPDKTSTNYDTAGIIGQRIRNTEIIVDKQQGEINLINSDLSENYYTKDETRAEIALTTEDIVSSVSEVTTSLNTALGLIDENGDAIAVVQSDLTQLTQDTEALTLKVENAGGVNILKNSAGLKGDIKDWQVYSGGSLVDARNNGTILQTTDVQTNTESGSAIQIANQFIEQTFNTIVGAKYTFYCRYVGNYVGDITITGNPASSLPASSSWTVFKIEFTATSTTTTLRIENGSGETHTISDMVVKLGDVTGWVQAPNEVYGKNYRFDKDGFTITSLTDPFKSVLDNTKLAVYDTSSGSDRIVMLVSKDSGKITKLIAQDEFVIRRYENAAASMRTIPVDDGAFLVIND